MTAQMEFRFSLAASMTSATNSSKKGDVVTESFVSESSSNLEALKSAYEAVSLHQIAMDLTDEVSVATNVDLKKIASNFNESLRTGLSSLNGGSSLCLEEITISESQGSHGIK